MKYHLGFYTLFLIPIITRGVVILKTWDKMKNVIPKGAMDRETYRNIILSMAGFSFSALLALVVVDVSLVKQDFHFSVYYLLISFLSYMIALNIQSYKARWWQGYFGSAFMESASLCLILAVLGLLYTGNFNTSFAIVMTIFAISIWLFDHVIRLTIDYRNFKESHKGGGDD